jgi:hypothetical protein
MEQRIRVADISPGIFSTERFVQIEVAGKPYSLLVDRNSVREDDRTMKVWVVESRDDDVLVELPRETFTAGSRFFIPRKELLPGGRISE